VNGGTTPRFGGKIGNSENYTELALKYVESAADAAGRSRLILLALLVASVVTFLASWNIRDEAWIRSRLEVEEDVLRWWHNLKLNQTPVFTDPRREARYTQARLYFTQRLGGGDAVDSARVDEEVHMLQQVRVEDLITLRMPFVGVVVDLNDLTFVSGVSFTAMLIWLSFSLSTERRNLLFVFSKAAEWGKLGLCDDLLMMRQVMSRPPQADESPSMHLSWRRLGLIFLPLGVPIWVMYHHAQSYEAALSINQAAARTGIMLAIAVTVGVVLTTVRCVYVSLKTDLEWEARARQLVRLRSETRATATEIDLFDRE